MNRKQCPGTNWIPVWPLPEQTTADLKYSASLTAPDGLPYGDPYWFTLTQTAVKEKPAEVATVFSLAQNYPNPFNPSTQIDFSIPQQSNVQLKVYNTLGQVVATLVNGNLSAGSHSVNFDARNLASGIVYLSPLRRQLHEREKDDVAEVKCRDLSMTRIVRSMKSLIFSSGTNLSV